MSESENETVQLYPDIGFYLLNYLNGIDACNFIEIVNDTSQFGSIAAATDHNFRNLMHQMFRYNHIIPLREDVFEQYLDDCEVIDNRLIAMEYENLPFIQPCQRLFVYNCFGVEGFRKLCRVYRTPLFQCYSRLLSFNVDLYSADFGLIDYVLFKSSLTFERELNEHERKLFRINTYFETAESSRCRSTIKFVNTLAEFRHNLSSRFFAHLWLDAIDFTKFSMVGSCVLNSLCHTAFHDTHEEDIKLIYSAGSCTEFCTAVQHALDTLQSIFANNQIEVKKFYGLLRYDVYLPCHIKLKFIYMSKKNSQNPLSHILYNFDFEISQITFTGDKLLCTFAFMQALATKCFNVYNLHGRTAKHTCIRIAKYCARGFQLLEPTNFDGDFDRLMKQTEIPLYRCEQREYINDDGEAQIETKEFWRKPASNIDTFEMQELFLASLNPEYLILI